MPSAPSTDLSDDDIAQRFRAAGIVVPADRAAGTAAAARRLLGVLHWLRAPRSVAAEPAAILVLGERVPR
ncbi:hypothetical protein [Lichenibacterium ramalinae]|uniref:hypothetical protein n=1 Tax=Lichenibacterium ramalinae TaxID=2316527 RepID=UPI0013EE019B|nr:hypothetical protein [Lichenibacterium ramalinae]